MSAAKLALPNPEYKDSHIEAVREFHAENRYMHLDTLALSSDFEAYVMRLCDPELQKEPLPEWAEYVPETVLWLVREDTYIGTLSIRHRLNWHLEKYGGHIGFVIRPGWRGKGFGKKILRLGLPAAQHLGLDRVLLTCASDNLAARRIIEKNGGVYQDDVPGTAQHPPRLRFWIDIGG